MISRGRSYETGRWVCLIAALSMNACASTQAGQQEVAVLRGKIALARERGAYVCAPRALARAEAHASFAESGIVRGVASRPVEHLDVARRNVDAALQRSEPSRCVSADQDKDGIVDPVDGCPRLPEDIDGFEDADGCPDPDNDADRIPDLEDRCPDAAGPLANGGCPDGDFDQDGLVDRKDQCPEQPGPVSNNGCPVLDRDGDEVLDANDECPDVPGKPPKGCPDKVLVEVTEAKIEIREKIQFATGKAIIKGDTSFMIIEQVASVLKSKGALKVVVEGHTDSIGSAAANLRLSERRAQSVVRALVERGVEAERLRAVGYGESQPIDANSSVEGRSRNRRVEFRIVEGG